MSKCMEETLPEPSVVLQSLQLSQCSMRSSPKPKVAPAFDAEGLELSKKSGKKYVGVKFHTLRGRWSGTVFYKAKPVCIGLFGTEVEAARAVKEAKHRIEDGTFTKPAKKTTKMRCRRWLNAPASRIAGKVKAEEDETTPGKDKQQVTLTLQPDPTAEAAKENVASQHVNSPWNDIFRHNDKVPCPPKRRRLSSNTRNNLQSGNTDGSVPSTIPCGSAKGQCTTPDTDSTAVDAFSRWMQVNQAQIAKELGTSDFLEVTHKCMEVWKNMSSEEQSAWIGRPGGFFDEDGLELSFTGRKAKYRGVTFHGLTRKWTTGVKLEGQHLYLGLYNTPKEAARARSEALTSISNGTFVKPEKKRKCRSSAP